MTFTNEQIDYVMVVCSCSYTEATETLDFAFSEPFFVTIAKAGAECRRQKLIDQAAARYRNEELAGLPLAELERRAGR